MDLNPLHAVEGNLFKDLPKPVVYGGIAVTAAVTGYLLYRRKKSTGSWFGSSTGTTSAGSPTAIDPVTGLAYSQDNVTDPITGETYLAEAQQYGSVASAEAAVSAYGTGSDTGTGIGVQPASGGDGSTTPAPGSVSSATYTSNAAWSTAAVAGLEDISGGPSYNGTDIATAIGDFVEGQPITQAQAQVVNVALSEFGQPPTGNLSIILKPAAAPGKTMVKIPQLAGKTTEEATTELETLNLNAANPKGTPQTNIVTSTTPAAGTSVTPKSLVNIHSETAPKKEAK